MDRTNTNTALCSAFAGELARCGVRHAILSPGSRSTPLAVALWRQPGIETSVVIDERSAGFIALGAAQASGRPVALLCTSGTAGANYHPAVAEADLSAVPLIVMTADRPPELRDNGSGQTIDQIKLFGSAVRWFAEVGSHLADDGGLLHYRATACRAFATAAGDPRPGPVHLNFAFREPLAPIAEPGAVTASAPLALEGRGELPLTSVRPAAPAPPEPEILDRLAERLAGTDRVLLLAGRRRDPGLREPLAALAAAGGWPVLAEPTSQLLCGPHDRSHLIPGYSRIGSSERYGVSGFADHPGLRPDLVIRFGEMPTSKGLRLWLGEHPEIEQVVIDPDHGWNEPTGTAAEILRADPAATVSALTERISDREGRADRGFLQAWRAASASLPEPDPGGTGPVFRALVEAMPDGGLLYVNSSMPIRDLEAFTPTLGSGLTFLANRGANGIDGLLASGIGAALAAGRPTVIVTGDVGFLHDLGSLANWSAAPLPPHILVLDNDGGAIFNRLPQKQALSPEEFEALMSTPPGLDIPAAAALFGLPYAELDDPADLAGLINGRPVLIRARLS